MMSFIINISSGSVSQCTVASGIVWRMGECLYFNMYTAQNE